MHAFGGRGVKMNYLVDIDGTLLNGSEPLIGAIEFVDNLNKNAHNYLLMTNSIKSNKVQQKRLANAGINVELQKILNPIAAINKYLLDNKIEQVKIIGSESEIEQIQASNTKMNYDIVILLDFEKSNLGYNDIQGIIDDVENGKKVITASLSTFYLKEGKKAIDTGAFVQIIENITNTKVANYGKPSIHYFEIAGNILNTDKNNIYVIGDDWNTDIVGANEYGAKSILVKTGKYKEKDELKCNPYKTIESLRYFFKEHLTTSST